MTARRYVLTEAQHAWLGEVVLAMQRDREELERRGQVLRQEIAQRYGIPVERLSTGYELDDALQRFVLAERPPEAPDREQPATPNA